MGLSRKNLSDWLKRHDYGDYDEIIWSGEDGYIDSVLNLVGFLKENNIDEDVFIKRTKELYKTRNKLFYVHNSLIEIFRNLGLKEDFVSEKIISFIE